MRGIIKFLLDRQGCLSKGNTRRSSIVRIRNLGCESNIITELFTAPEAGASNFFSRATPVVAEGGLLLVGMYGPAVVLAIRRRNGRLVWMSAPLDVAAHSVITMSGTAYQG
jgi:hypothetical protein